MRQFASMTTKRICGATGRYLVKCSMVLFLIQTAHIHHISAACEIPPQFRGDYFSMELGDDVNTLINPSSLKTEKFEGSCIERWDDNTTIDANNNFDGKLLFFSPTSTCYRCYNMLYRTPNIVQYQHTDCISPTDGRTPTLEDVCSNINPQTDYYTYFRKALETVNCKNTVEGVYHFTYEWDVGGGGICDNPNSRITACQEPGSPYVDNQVFTMYYAKCPEVSTSSTKSIKFQCMGSWTDDKDNVYSGVADLGKEVYRERFRCMLTRRDQEQANNKFRFTMSWWAECSSLKSPYEGPIRHVVQPSLGSLHTPYMTPECNFPKDNSGHWYHLSENDVDVDINTTHVYFKTRLDQYTYRESYFICMMNSGTRYLTVAITVGKCEVDFVCLDLQPRNQNIVRWRMGKPYRLTETEKADPDYRMNMFRQACAWSSFTINRNDVAWRYKTFLLNPPTPYPCPVRGRYTFTQSGPETELLTTRIRGITVRPRHMIDCKEYISEFRSCESNPTVIQLDAEYCNTLDFTGRPIGEYDVPDWELSCIGQYNEDWNLYLYTWDPEDATSPFRCWQYERIDWRHIWMTRSTGAFCTPEMPSNDGTIEEGASLSLVLTESERLYDDCPMAYLEGGDPVDQSNPYNSYETLSEQGQGLENSSSRVAQQQHQKLLLILLFVLTVSLKKFVRDS